MLLSLASQRIEYLIVELVGTLLDDDDLFDLVKEWEKKERGSLPSIVETVIILWQVGERSTKFKMLKMHRLFVLTGLFFVPPHFLCTPK